MRMNSGIIDLEQFLKQVNMNDNDLNQVLEEGAAGDKSILTKLGQMSKR